MGFKSELLGGIVGIGGLAAVYKYASEEGASYKIMRIKSYIDGLFFWKLF